MTKNPSGVDPPLATPLRQTLIPRGNNRNGNRSNRIGHRRNGNGYWRLDVGLRLRSSRKRTFESGTARNTFTVRTNRFFHMGNRILQDKSIVFFGHGTRAPHTWAPCVCALPRWPQNPIRCEQLFFCWKTSDCKIRWLSTGRRRSLEALLDIFFGGEQPFSRILMRRQKLILASQVVQTLCFKVGLERVSL